MFSRLIPSCRMCQCFVPISLNNIPLCGYTTCLSVHLLVDIGVVSTLTNAHGAALNVGVQIFTRSTLFSDLGYIARRIIESYGTSVFNL